MPYYLSSSFQEFVTVKVAVFVIYLFKIINVQHSQEKMVVLAVGPARLLEHLGIKITSVIKTCEPIGNGKEFKLALAGVVVLLVTRYVLSKIPGLTGDIYGAIAVLTEAVVLLLYSVRVEL